MLEQYVKKILTSRVYDVAVETPLQAARQLSERLGNKVLLKREDLQPVFSFKIRGAYNKLTQLTAQERACGVVTASAGNHAQGLALAAKVARQSPSSVTACKTLIQGARSRPLVNSLPDERTLFLGLFDTQDQKEGVQAFLEKRVAEWKNG